jgi:hypothetical protein
LFRFMGWGILGAWVTGFCLRDGGLRNLVRLRTGGEDGYIRLGGSEVRPTRWQFMADECDIMKARLPGMKALEFDTQLANHDQIRVPAEVADQIPEGSVLRVILLLGTGEDDGWSQLGLDRFAAAYSEEDAVYEKLE